MKTDNVDLLVRFYNSIVMRSELRDDASCRPEIPYFCPLRHDIADGLWAEIKILCPTPEHRRQASLTVYVPPHDVYLHVIASDGGPEAPYLDTSVPIPRQDILDVFDRFMAALGETEAA